MDRGAWWAAVHGAAKVGHDLGTEAPSAREAQAAHTPLHSKQWLFLTVICVPSHERNSESKCKWIPVRHTDLVSDLVFNSWLYLLHLDACKYFSFLRSSS